MASTVAESRPPDSRTTACRLSWSEFRDTGLPTGDDSRLTRSREKRNATHLSATHRSNDQLQRGVPTAGHHVPRGKRGPSVDRSADRHTSIGDWGDGKWRQSTRHGSWREGHRESGTSPTGRCRRGRSIPGRNRYPMHIRHWHPLAGRCSRSTARPDTPRRSGSRR